MSANNAVLPVWPFFALSIAFDRPYASSVNPNPILAREKIWLICIKSVMTINKWEMFSSLAMLFTRD